MNTNFNIPVIGFVGYSGSGKTTLLGKMITLLKQNQYRIGLVKHAHHDFDIDIPGKDSYELRQAGAEQVIVASAKREALIIEHPDSGQDPDLSGLIKRLDQKRLDLILVEGFKHESFDKIEVHRRSNNTDLLFSGDHNIIAVACDTKIENITLPVFDLDDINAIFRFIVERYLSK